MCIPSALSALLPPQPLAGWTSGSFLSHEGPRGENSLRRSEWGRQERGEGKGRLEGLDRAVGFVGAGRTCGAGGGAGLERWDAARGRDVDRVLGEHFLISRWS